MSRAKSDVFHTRLPSFGRKCVIGESVGSSLVPPLRTKPSDQLTMTWLADAVQSEILLLRRKPPQAPFVWILPVCG